MSRWICSACGTENDADANFCKNCASKRPVVEEEPKQEENVTPTDEAPVERSNEPETTKVETEPVTTPVKAPKKKSFKKKLLISIGVILAIFIVLSAIGGPKVTAVVVSYSGDTEEGIVIDEKNSGLEVWGLTDDAQEVSISGWTVKEPVTLVADESSTVTVVYKDIECDIEVICTSSKVESIVAEYTGPTEEGTVIDSSSSIEVTATHLDGSITEDISGWTVIEPVTLVADETSKVEVVYEDISTEVEVKCSTVTLLKIAASYDGGTREGVELDSDNEGIHVIAKYKDGSKKEVSDFTIEKPATLKAGKTSKVKIKYEDKECTLKVECTTLSESQYKEKCKSIAYEDLARNPDKYEGEYIKFTGKVVQTMEDGYIGALRVNVTKGSYGYYDDTVYVIYIIDSENRILEDDIVNLYGTSDGLYSYESVMGATITIPSMYASYVELSK